MASQRTRYRCQQCEHVELRWLGRCPSCGAWNTLEEEPGEAGASGAARSSRWRAGSEPTAEAIPISRIDARKLERLPVQPDELARVMGGGLVPGSLVLLGGAPGVGKSTLLTSLSAQVAEQGRRVVYLSAEESGAQVRGRAERLGALSEHLLLVEEPALERVLPPLYEKPPALLVVDSIQTVHSRQLESTPGSVAQIRTCGGLLADFARTTGCVVVLVGHLTKEGDLAGPRLLEHLVDTVLYFEPESGGALRLVRAFKNRFGPIGELAVFEMTGQGLVPVRDASGMFLRNRRTAESGSAVTAVFTGSRPFLVEVQALVVKTQYGIPTRVVTGVDAKRVALLAAVADRKANVEISPCDVYVKIAGGLRTQDPAADLALIAALVSSKQNRALAPDVVLLGEVGLTGDLRPVPQLPLRLSEAAAHGFHRAVAAPGDRRRPAEVPAGFELLEATDVRDALRLALGGSGARAERGR